MFAVLEAEMAAGAPDDHWFGYFGYACRPDLPAAPSAAGLPDAVWMRAPHVRLFDHPEPARRGLRAGLEPTAVERLSTADRARPSTPRRSTGSRSTCTRATPTR